MKNSYYRQINISVKNRALHSKECPYCKELNRFTRKIDYKDRTGKPIYKLVASDVCEHFFDIKMLSIDILARIEFRKNTVNTENQSMPIYFELRERSEHYSSRELQIIERWNEKVFTLHDMERIYQYIEKDIKRPFLLFACKGTGKTLNTILAIRKAKRECINIKPRYIVYKQNQKLQEMKGSTFELTTNTKNTEENSYITPDWDDIFTDGNIVVIDDVHYFYDAIRYNNISDKPLVDLFERAIEFSKRGNKVIFISEDVISKEYCEYIKDERFLKLLPYISHTYHDSYEQMVYGAYELKSFSGMAVLSLYSHLGRDKWVEELLSGISINPRSVVKLIKLCNYQIDFKVLMSIAKARLLEDQKGEQFIKQNLPMHLVENAWDKHINSKLEGSMRENALLKIAKDNLLIPLMDWQTTGLKEKEIDNKIKYLLKKVGTRKGMHMALFRLYSSYGLSSSNYLLSKPLIYAFFEEIYSEGKYPEIYSKILDDDIEEERIFKIEYDQLLDGLKASGELINVDNEWILTEQGNIQMNELFDKYNREVD